MKERIVEFLRAENKSSAIFAEEIGVLASSISHIISGRNNPSLDFILKMLKRYPSLSSDWLLFGRGNMYGDAAQNNLFDAVNYEKPINEAGFEFEVDNVKINPVNAPEKTNELQNHEIPLKKSVGGKHTVRIVCFYDDNTFSEYYPEDQG